LLEEENSLSLVGPNFKTLHMHPLIRILPSFQRKKVGSRGSADTRCLCLFVVVGLPRNEGLQESRRRAGESLQAGLERATIWCKKFQVTREPELGSILSYFDVPNSMIPEILAAAEKIMMSDAGALSAGVFLCVTFTTCGVKLSRSSGS
jgi:hypothetical protein